MNIRAWLQPAAENKTRLIVAVLIGLGAFWLLRGCIPGLDGSLLPTDVEEAITRTYTTCISREETPIQYNEARQPECGRVDIRVAGEGRVPADAQAAGITRAICYKVSIENPYWTTLATTRHEVKWKGRSVSKVTVWQNNAWQLFPDQGNLDEQRWAAFACPEAYESMTGESPLNK
jgi:hypothetical protein